MEVAWIFDVDAAGPEGEVVALLSDPSSFGLGMRSWASWYLRPKEMCNLRTFLRKLKHAFETGYARATDDKGMAQYLAD
jgi:hypothetical protein